MSESMMLYNDDSFEAFIQPLTARPPQSVLKTDQKPSSALRQVQSEGTNVLIASRITLSMKKPPTPRSQRLLTAKTTECPQKLSDPREPGALDGERLSFNHSTASLPNVQVNFELPKHRNVSIDEQIKNTDILVRE